jgi:hypothetical protein
MKTGRNSLILSYVAKLIISSLCFFFRYIGYALGRKTTFAKAAADCLWPRYSLELDSWRDQPLWCYCLDHWNITPIPLEHKKIWKLQTKRMGKQGHKYKTEDEASVKYYSKK